MAPFADAATIKRQLTIKTGVENSYLKEAQEQQVRIQKFIDDGRDEYDVKQQRTVLQDTLKMIPDCRKRLELATDELHNYLEGLEEEDDSQVKSTTEFTTAKEVLAEVQGQLQGPLSSV
ncbi:related to Tubulin-specific chaperone A [Ustilago trichophora]|uniref:Tubulin-specific chaperone A n=1 Tax=Ustilago trichophora TaxID=86804 RepID=A0A5C3DX55_9BASI|nr:related to Tubulin-specific chaperone A [Ustilago trichophora]